MAHRQRDRFGFFSSVTLWRSRLVAAQDMCGLKTREARTMKVIAVANQKGGVGKTTVTRELSACCALRGYQTLVIDSDPQANLTASWVEPEIYNITLSHVLIEPEAQAGAKLERRDLDDAIVESPLTNLDLVPADIRLARFEMQPDYLAHRLTKQIGEHASVLRSCIH
jgi:cellulose biosynthesis protein BcsQ